MKKKKEKLPKPRLENKSDDKYPATKRKVKRGKDDNQTFTSTISFE